MRKSSQKNRSRNIFWSVIIIIISSSCKNDTNFSIDLKKVDYKNLKYFQLHRIKENKYKIQFDENNKGIFSIDSDTAFIVFDHDVKKTKYPLFVKDQFSEMEFSSFFVTENRDTCKIKINRIESLLYNSICNTKLTLLSKKNSGLCYNIWFSFEKGILQISVDDLISVQILSFIPKIKYEEIPVNDSIAYI